MTIYIELATLSDFNNIFTIEKNPVWRAVLWISPYIKNLKFMNENPQYTGAAVTINEFYADRIAYSKTTDYNTLRDRPMSWMIMPSSPHLLYVNFANNDPAYFFKTIRIGIVISFSYQKIINRPNIKTLPLLLEFPNISDSFDNLNYKKMKFDTGIIEIDNSNGIMDDRLSLFGNTIAVNAMEESGSRIIREFYIHDYEVSLQKAAFNVRDKRNRISFNAPSKTYSLSEYPDIDPKLVDKEIQDAYGRCVNVPGTPVNQNQVYNLGVPASGFNNWFRFKFARTITAIEEAWMLKSDVWTQIFPGLGVPLNTVSPNHYQTKNPNPIKVITNNGMVDVTEANKDSLPENNGEIAVWWSQALKDNVGHLERRNGKPDKIRLTGTFVDLHNPGDIIKDIIMYHGDNLYEDQLFDLQTWEEEFFQELPIGVVLEKKEQGFQAIEKIQNSSLLGFQLLVDGDKFSVRVDNPNRGETFDIRYNEIENRDALSVEFSGDYYASSVSVGYNRDWQAKEYERHIDNSRETEIIDIYQMEKELAIDTYINNFDLAGVKGEYISEIYSRVNPIIKGIVLEGLRWDNIKMFSTGWIDFVLPLPRNMKALQPFLTDRNSLGKLRVKIIGWDRDLKTGKITIDVIRSERSIVLENFQNDRNRNRAAFAMPSIITIEETRPLLLPYYETPKLLTYKEKETHQPGNIAGLSKRGGANAKKKRKTKPEPNGLF